MQADNTSAPTYPQVQAELRQPATAAAFDAGRVPYSDKVTSDFSESDGNSHRRSADSESEPQKVTSDFVDRPGDEIVTSDYSGEPAGLPKTGLDPSSLKMPVTLPEAAVVGVSSSTIRSSPILTVSLPDKASSDFSGEDLMENHSPVSNDQPTEKVTSDFPVIEEEEEEKLPSNVISLDARKAAKEKSRVTIPSTGKRRGRKSTNPEKPPTPPYHQWRPVDSGWQLWRVNYVRENGKQKKKLSFVPHSYLNADKIRKVNEQYGEARENFAGSIFD